MENPINFRMISHPMNWLTIFLMLVIAGTAGHLLLSFFGMEPATANNQPQNSYSSVPAGDQSQTAPQPSVQTA